MKCFRKLCVGQEHPRIERFDTHICQHQADVGQQHQRLRYAGLLLVPVLVTAGWAAAEWRNPEAGTPIEAALYRWMPMPVSKVLGLRPPKEATPLLSELLRKQPTAELYSLRALNEEAALDFAAAEADWKRYAESATQGLQGHWALADFYMRRARPTEEINALGVIARAPADASEKRLAVEQQGSWRAFERIFRVIGANALAAEVSEQNYRAWLERYPEQQGVYDGYLQFLLEHRSFAEADKLIARYQAARPQDEIFPVKARAVLEYRKGSVEQGLATYDTHFQPLWPQELIDSYFALLKETRSSRRFLDQARAALERNPDDLSAAARIFYYYQRQGRTDAAQQALAQIRVRKEQRNAKWSSQELYTLARLSEGIKDYPEAARYYYALYNTNDRADAPELSLAGLVSVLLDAPEQSIRVGSGDLSMYRDIATMDRGPGFLNGILSLVMNTTSPGYAYSTEQQRAVPYFHRAEAAQLTRLFESRFPNSSRRAELRARLIETYSVYGQSGAVIRDGREFLTAFPNSVERERVAMLLADAYARENRTQDEFALYDAELAELAKRSDGQPIGAGGARKEPEVPAQAEGTDEEAEDPAQANTVPGRGTQSFSTHINAPSQAAKTPQAWYATFLERYLSRLASMQQVPQAMAVLRKEIDRNPNDPGLYERLAQFLEQNRLGEQQEQVYERAIQQFQDKSWYHKLARFYLKQKRNADFSRLSEQVVKIFSGSELESYFSDVVSSGQYYTRLNEFAHTRFPHDLMFVRNLANAYQRSRPPQTQKWEELIRQHWWEAEDLRNQFFEYLSRTGRLDQELAALGQAQNENWASLAGSNPVAARFVGEVGFWRSHFEEAAPVMIALTQQYPADFELGRRASSVYRSLAAYDPHNTDVAIQIEENLYKADPRNRETLARIGDILADRELFARAAPYWDRIPQIRPGEAQAYLDTASIYWDYYDYDSALKWLSRGREKLANPSLYAYEAGAIYEGKRDYPSAIAEYVKGALQEHEGSRPYNRLLDLARRKTTRDEVERATAGLANGPASEVNAIKLRLAVLESENRPKEVEQLLSAISERSSSLETLEWIEETARNKSLTGVQEKALEKQAAVTTDPVRKLELHYSLVHFYEANREMQKAERNIDALYRENPKIQGVVRSTVDFYWQNKAPQRAIEVLQQAANDAYPELAAQFRFEAAQKSTENAQYEQARKLLAQLLSAAPYNGQYLAAMADTYARAGDDAGLKKFYLDEIEAFRNAKLAPEARTQQIATLRRGLIPALTRLKDYSGAVDQYVEITNRFPEDDGLITEAALYAQRNGRKEQLLGYYANTMKQSPRDYLWPMVLAKLQMQVEDYPAAVASFAAAINVRPDRVDLRSRRAELLERLMRFDEAAADYQKLFDLDYHNARWMEKVAEIRARQGRAPDSIAALEAALIKDRPEKPSNYFEVARRLEGWGMLQQARDYAQRGVDAAGRDLLAISENHGGAQLYMEIMTRLRQQNDAYARLQRAMTDATSLGAQIAVAVNQVEKNGIVSITDQQWRDQALATRRETAGNGMKAAMQALGKAVQQYFTPEEKAQVARWLQNTAAQGGDAELANIYLAAAESAELADVQARWLKQLMLNNYGGQAGSYKYQLVQLQTQRLRFQELGQALEAYAQKLSARQGRDGVLTEAANAYRSGGLRDSEFRVLSTVALRTGGELQQRYFELLLQRQPQELARLAGTARDGVADVATQYAVAHGTASLAQSAVTAHGATLRPVWTSAYTALTGLYFSDRNPAINSAFLTALGDGTIGERLGKTVDRDRQLAGNTWFYYGSRYGEWLGVTRSGDPEEFLPAQLEQSPASAAGYISVAEYYADAGDVERATEDYRHTLELAPARADIHDRIAVLYWRQQKRADAIAEWKRALELLDAQVDLRAVPAAFWPTFADIMNHIGARRITAELRPQSDLVLRDYIRKNGVYRAEELLRPGYNALGNPQAGVSVMLELASIAPEPGAMLELLVRADWIPLTMRGPIYEQIIAHAQDRLRGLEGISRQYEEERLRSWQGQYAMYLVQQKEYERAASVLPTHEQPTELELEVRYRIALAKGQFDPILDQYRAHPEKAPQPEVLRRVATSMQSAGERAAARKLLEFLFTREIAAHQLSAANMLGLAEIRLQDGDTAGAMELLRRLTLVVGEPFENLEPAATLLARNGRHAEAAEFLTQLVKAKPWDANARARLAQEQMGTGTDVAGARAMATAVASDSSARYADRVAAAAVLSGSGSSLGSGELDYLAYGTGSPDQPYFFTARLNAAKKSAPALAAPLLLNAVADAPQQDAAWVPLFNALVKQKRDRLALALVQPLQRKGYLQYVYSGHEGDESAPDLQVDTGGDDAEVAERDVNERRSAQASPERAALTGAVADAYASIGDRKRALQYYRSALELQNSEAERAKTRSRIASVRAAIRREATNALRMPTIHKELDQEHTVRPRLVAATKAATPVSSRRGVAQ